MASRTMLRGPSAPTTHRAAIVRRSPASFAITTSACSEPSVTSTARHPSSSFDLLLVGEVGAQHLLDQRLRHLLCALRRQFGCGAEPEAVVDMRDLLPRHGLHERHPLRPVRTQRRDLAKAIRDAPAAEVLHRAHRCRLRARPRVLHGDSRFDDDHRHGVEGQLFGERQPDRTAADDHHGADFFRHVCELRCRQWSSVTLRSCVPTGAHVACTFIDWKIRLADESRGWDHRA